MESRGNPKEFVHEYYNNATYAKPYAPIIKPIHGPSDWDLTQHTPPNPPPYKKLPGRPSRKKRILEPGEKKKNIKKQKVGAEKMGNEVRKKSRCSVCRELGHNKRKCKATELTPWPESKGKGGRPLEDDPFVEKIRAKRLKNQTSTHVKHISICICNCD